MRKFSVFTAAMSLAAVLGLGNAAWADGYVSGGKGFAPPPVYSWSGVYMGVHGGYGWGRLRNLRESAANPGDHSS